jgi:hypothetical protein
MQVEDSNIDNPQNQEEEDWDIESDAEIVEIINQRLTSLDPFQKCKKLKVCKMETFYF